MPLRRSLLKVIQSDRHIQGYTHSFYRYPAATSPELVREVLLRYSEPGDWVLDPFMGGGTSVVEALAHGRRAVGLDVNPLAVFVARAKTTLLTGRDQSAICDWVKDQPFGRVDSGTVIDPRAIGLPTGLRRPLEAALSSLAEMDNGRQRSFAKCSLLRTSQWALETRDKVPSVSALHEKLSDFVEAMMDGLEELVLAARDSGVTRRHLPGRRLLLRGRAEEADLHKRLNGFSGKLRLVVTSPPYPGVHVLYHRWQIRSRRETGAPYWIAGSRDGLTPSYYTMGGRTAIGLERYFSRLTEAYAAIRRLLTDDALVVQLVGFSSPDEQLPRYLAAMRAAGYRSAKPTGYRTGELMRRVPNRRWYARDRDLNGSREHLLFHAPSD